MSLASIFTFRQCHSFPYKGELYIVFFRCGKTTDIFSSNKKYLFKQKG
jgi:hypothetical protein